VTRLLLKKNLLNFSILSPILFAFLVLFTGNVNFPNATIESFKYIEIAKFWIDESSTSWPIESILQRLPLYPLFIYLNFKIFGFNNLVALLFFQSFLGSLTIFLTIKILKTLKLDHNIIVILSILFNLHIFYRFSVFLPNAFFLFFVTVFIYFFTNFYFLRDKKSFFYLSLCIPLLLLIRPLFQLSIVLVIPLIIFFILKKTNFSRFSKLIFSFFLVLTYLIGMSVQVARNYAEYGKLTYTSQTGDHSNSLVTAFSITEKSGCGDMDAEMMKEIVHIFEMEKGKLNMEDKNNMAILDGIRLDISKKILTERLEKKEILYSIFCGYFKTLFHPSFSAIYQAFGMKLEGFSKINGEDFLEKIENFFKTSFKNLQNFSWLFSLILLFFMRIIQLYGLIYAMFFSNQKYYFLCIFSIFLTIFIPAIGMSSLRFRTEIETLLLIFGAVGIVNLANLKIFKHKELGS